MKKNNRQLFASLLLCLLATAAVSCSDDKEEGDALTPLVLYGEIFSIDSDVATVWSGGQSIGLYVLNAGTETVTDAYANVKYLADNRGTTGYLVPADNQPIYLPDDGSAVDLRAYYPYDATATDSHITRISLTKGTKPDALLYSRNCTALSKHANQGTARLSSMLAQVNIEFVCSLEGAYKVEAAIKGAVTGADFHILPGTFSWVEGETATLEMTGSKSTATDGSVAFRMKSVILPGDANAKATLEVSVSDNKGNLLKQYAPIPVHDVLEMEGEGNVDHNTDYHISAQLTESDQVETQLTGTSAICILNWNGTSDDPESGVARPE